MLLINIYYLLLSVQCYAWTEYKFTCVCLCVRHTFCQLAYTSDPSTDFLQLINVKNTVYRHVNGTVAQPKQQISELGC